MHGNLRRDGLWRRLLPFAFVAAAIATLGGPAQAAPGPSTYAAAITPNVVEEGATNNFTFTITKVSGGNNIGAFNIVVPSQFTVNLPFGPITPASLGKDWSATLNGSTIEVRAAQTKSQPSLKNGQSLNLQVSMTASATCAPGSYALDVTATNSRTFSGGAIIEGNDPTITCYDQICTAGACDQTDPNTGTILQTTVPTGGTLGINFHGTPNDGCGTEEDGLARVQLDPLNYIAQYSVAFFVPGANGSTDVCKSSDGGLTFEALSSCSDTNPAPCIASETGGAGGRTYVLNLLPGDPNIDFI